MSWLDVEGLCVVTVARVRRLLPLEIGIIYSGFKQYETTLDFAPLLSKCEATTRALAKSILKTLLKASFFVRLGASNPHLYRPSITYHILEPHTVYSIPYTRYHILCTIYYIPYTICCILYTAYHILWRNDRLPGRDELLKIRVFHRSASHRSSPQI